MNFKIKISSPFQDLFPRSIHNQIYLFCVLALVELIAHAKADQDYQKVLDAVHRHEDLRQLPRDHPAQSSRSYWDSLAVEPELPGLILYRSTYHCQARDPQDPTRSTHKGDKKLSQMHGSSTFGLE